LFKLRPHRNALFAIYLFGTTTRSILVNEQPQCNYSFAPVLKILVVELNAVYLTACPGGGGHFSQLG
jgi:hypothetical protein